MEITIKMSEHTTRHKYIEDKEQAQEFYNEMCKEYGKENVFISGAYSKFYL